MRQQVEVTVKITLDVDAKLTKEELRKGFEEDINTVLSKAHITLAPYHRKGVLDCVMLEETEILSIKEEADIYDVEQEQTTGDYGNI